MSPDLCTSIEPVTKAVMCQKPHGHPISEMHEGDLVTPTGITHCSWYDVSYIKTVLGIGTKGESQ